MDALSRAKLEVELAIADREATLDDPEHDILCLRSALYIYDVICNEGHSGASLNITMSILNRLASGKPLVPITDKNAQWGHAQNVDDKKTFQSARMTSLFKTVHSDGHISYSDVHRVEGRDKGEYVCYFNGEICDLINKMFPITFPYTGDEHWIVTTETFLTDRKNGDFDTRAILYADCNDGRHVDIYHYYKEDPNAYDMVEITAAEFEERRNLAQQLSFEERSKLAQYLI